MSDLFDEFFLLAGWKIEAVETVLHEVFNSADIIVSLALNGRRRDKKRVLS